MSIAVAKSSDMIAPNFSDKLIQFKMDSLERSQSYVLRD